MFPTAKTPKSQRPDNRPLYFYRLHTKASPENYNAFWGDEYRQLTILDIGYTNLCRRVSRRFFKPKKVQTLVFDKTSVTIEADDEEFRILFRDIEIWLDQHRDVYLQSHVIIIEWQLGINYKAVRISTFILSYFHFLLKDAPLLPFLLEMRSGFKDDYFPVLKPLNQNARKEKCVELGKELFKLMGDQDGLGILESGSSRKKKKKQDDFADTALMEEVFCRFASANGWLFPHYENSRRIVVTRKSKE